MLRLEGVAVSYGRVAALRDVSLDIRPGELVGLIGANGAGKSTILKTVSGLLRPIAGRITWEGRSLAEMTPREILKRGIAHCPEGRRVFPHLTVRENLIMGAFLRRDRAAVAEDLERMHHRFPRLGERSGQIAGTLSGGEQQMLAIARSLMSRPRLVMFDEPSLGLAPNIVEQVFAIINDIRSQGATVLMVEQNALAALRMSDRAYLLETGRVVLSGTGRELLDSGDVRSIYLGGDAPIPGSVPVLD